MQDDRGATALHYAVREGCKQIFDALLDAGSAVDIQDYTHKTAEDYVQLIKDPKKKRAMSARLEFHKQDTSMESKKTNTLFENFKK